MNPAPLALRRHWTVSVRDFEQPPDLKKKRKSGTMQQAGEESKCDNVDAESFDWSSGANISGETKEYIGKIMNRGLQRRLRLSLIHI